MSTKLKKQAKKLAKKGRFGDKHLIHINDEELYSLMAARKLHKNPHTGLPEAWSPTHGDFSLSGSFDNVRNFAEAGFGGSAVMGPLGSFGAGINDIQNPGGAADTVFKDIGGVAMLAGGAEVAGGLPWWGGGAAPEAADAVAPFYGDVAPDYAGMGATSATGVDDSAYADQWATDTSQAAGGPRGGVSSGAAPWTGKDYLMASLGGTQIATGAYGLYNAYQGRQAQKAQQKQQQSYYDQLNNLMANPGQVTSLPGYQFNLNQGADALQRRMAAMGYGSSGNMGTALTRYGQDYATAALGQQEQLLASQYGRASPPTETMPDPTQLAMSSLSNMGYGFAPFMRG